MIWVCPVITGNVHFLCHKLCLSVSMGQGPSLSVLSDYYFICLNYILLFFAVSFKWATWVSLASTVASYFQGSNITSALDEWNLHVLLVSRWLVFIIQRHTFSIHCVLTINVCHVISKYPKQEGPHPWALCYLGLTPGHPKTLTTISYLIERWMFTPSTTHSKSQKPIIPDLLLLPPCITCLCSSWHYFPQNFYQYENYLVIVRHHEPVKIELPHHTDRD